MCCLFVTKKLAKHQQCEVMKKKPLQGQHVPCGKFVKPMPSHGQHLAGNMFTKLILF